MQQEIKYRVKGNSGDKVWTVYSVPGCFKHCETAMELFDWSTLSKFTGLKDRKGIDIYEGDIVVRFYYYDDLYPGEYDPTTRQKKIVKWTDKPNCLLGYNIRRLKDGTANHLLVVGNIYDNKDLLNER